MEIENAIDAAAPVRVVRPARRPPDPRDHLCAGDLKPVSGHLKIGEIFALVRACANSATPPEASNKIISRIVLLIYKVAGAPAFTLYIAMV